MLLKAEEGTVHFKTATAQNTNRIMQFSLKFFQGSLCTILHGSAEKVCWSCLSKIHGGFLLSTLPN